jgi:hypothetical protein
LPGPRGAGRRRRRTAPAGRIGPGTARRRSPASGCARRAIRDRGSPIRNNSDRTARVYEKRNHSGRHVCVTRSGGSIHDLRGYNLNDQTRSLKINRNDCGCPHSPLQAPDSYAAVSPARQASPGGADQHARSQKGGRLRGETLCRASAERSSGWGRTQPHGEVPVGPPVRCGWRA